MNPETTGTTSHASIPPKPPDLPTDHSTSTTNSTPNISNTASFKEKLLSQEIITDTLINSNINMIDYSEPMRDESSDETLSSQFKHISLTDENRERMYSPWQFSLIIKLLVKRVVHQYLKRKIQDLWKPNEPFPLIDIGSDFYVVKFTKEENMAKTLQQAPWFINGHYLSVRRWEPNFVASKAKEVYLAVWVRLPQLPTEFYDGIVLARIGNSIGKLLRIDACTSSTIRGRYVRLCVQVPLDQPVQTAVQIGYHLQQLLYEGENFLCKACGRLGHTAPSCIYPKTVTVKQIQTGPWVISSNSTGKGQTSEDLWQTVSFPRGNKHKRYTAAPSQVKD
ncbi:PREDICTED: uncharacterized protein LOC109208333 [Nicotiana attenuata]|uniref:uncharacterized protein LOC109208333 n=1 Tax=Nicotiana attenuata TaxID=49451 RepID=UPI000905C4EB|nr:PREDICTED: uncharacterized protein LOC109208333 [Nicotiana attenuata]